VAGHDGAVTVASRPYRARAALPAVVGTVLALLLSGCTQVVSGTASAAPVPATAAVAAPTRTEAPAAERSAEVAEAAARMLQEFWGARFPAEFGRPWDEIDTFTAVRTRRPDAPPPPCLERAADVSDQAFYCPTRDAIAWDADGLLPDLYERFGTAGVVVVIAHEVGHAVQSRLGVDDAQAREPRRHPTVLLEAMADCYAGVVVAHLVEEPVPGLPIGLPERDDALRALVGFSDPIGVDSADRSAHGNAFDRVSAFQDGYRNGAAGCAGMSLDNREFTQRRFGSQADLARGGNLPLPELLAAVEGDVRGWFGGLVTGDGQAPAIAAPESCPGPAGGAQGPVAYCAATGAVTVDRTALARLHDDLGDYAGATLIASRYGLALLDAAGRPATGAAAGAAATCLAGAYTARLIDAPAGFRLSPGDLDEAVQVLLTADWAARDAAGEADPADHGFERVGDFRTGLLDGSQACLPA
jgi:predicted metalloprotease